MRKGLNFAWEGKWEQAMEAYQKALSEMPDDPAVRNHLGLAYLKLERFEAALEAYGKASRLDPENPAPLTRLVEIHAKLGQRRAAADAAFSLAKIHRRQREWKQSIQALQQTVRFQSDHVLARETLAEIYTELDQPQRAARERLSLARILQQRAKTAEALEQCRLVIDLDPRNAEARALAEALHLDEAGGAAAKAPVEETETPPAPAEEGASPAAMTRDVALGELAEMVFEETLIGPVPDIAVFEEETGREKAPQEPTLSRPQIDALIAQAIDFQTRGLIDEAIACYTKVIGAGVDRPAAHFNLGLLYQQRLRFESAISEFSNAVQHPDYILGSHFALGECYKALGRLDDALEHFVEALKIVDLGTVQREQADDLMQLYDALADSYVAKGDREQALTFTNTLVEFLSSKGWEDKAREARQRIDGLGEEGMPLSLAEILAESNADTVLTAMSLSQEYMKRGVFTAATEVCYRAIEAAPTYLPVHLRLAEICTQNDRVEEAVNKYQLVADLYLVREETRHAIGVYERMLRLKPMDVVTRSRMIDLLITLGEIDRALEQYLALADAYYQMAQMDKALEKYTEALRLAPRASDDRKWQARLLRQTADLQLRRANWREAAKLYEQLVALTPEDERAQLQLIDLKYKLGRAKEADKEVVAMIDYFRSRGEGERALALLREAVRLQPQQMALRARLARAYINAGNREEAIGELDALGELQLEHGLREQAITTVQFIISLKPKNADAYRELLSQL
ncbi:MAG: tetratricopeptide repeat protein [Anaerolineae bacterium]